MAVYEATLAHWPVPYAQLDLPTRYGKTHILASGPQDAAPLVLLHGQLATATMWSGVIAQLSGDHRAYALDQIDDVGKSLPTRVPASRADYAEWLLDVFDQLQLPQADVVGLSYGGFLALNFALAAPERVKRLILLCPGTPSFGPPTLKWALHGLPMSLFPTRAAARWLVQGMSVQGYHSGNAEAEQIIAGVVNIRSRIPFRPVVHDDEFGALKIPVLLLIGEAETMYDPRSAAERARKLIPHIQAEIIPDAGHMLTTDQPELVVNRIHWFLHLPM